jgi:RNA polymerase sigma-70 factor, ECF subfamily
MNDQTTANSALATRAHELRALLVPFIAKRVDPQDVDDVVQTVFVRIQRGLADLRDTEKLVAWGYQIARNVIVDHTRRPTGRTLDPLERARSVASPAADEDDFGSHELALIIGHFIGMLPEPYREALQLTELDGLTQAEAAQRVGLSLPGMKSRVQRGRAQLRQLLEACCSIELDTRGGIIDVEPHNAPAELPNCCARNRASFAADVRLHKHDEQNPNHELRSVEPEH